MKVKNPNKLKEIKLARRHGRVRAVICGTAEAPRISVRRSLKHVFVQLIDDEAGKTLVSANDLELGAKVEAGERKGKVAKAYAAGKLLAERAVKAGIKKAVFDRGGRQYHGRVAAVAEGARDGGLKF